jgi:Tol biopolymer transport system component
MIAFVCHQQVNSLITGGVCTVDAVDGVLGALNGAGDGAGRADLGGLIPGRPDGPPAFAWRPDASTRIAFVRDTILDSLAGVYSSRVYTANGDGSTVVAISPRIADLGRGPLRISGGIDWSPDGNTIVFTAGDTTSYESSLYALDVTTGGIRRLTTPPINWFGDFYPKFSPDGTRILFQRINTYYCCAMITDFYSVRLTGGGPTRLTYEGGGWPGSNFDAYHLGGDWSPNGLSVIVTGVNGVGGRAAYRVPTDVTSQADYLARRVLVGTAGIAGLNDYQVSWQP